METDDCLFNLFQMVLLIEVVTERSLVAVEWSAIRIDHHPKGSQTTTP